MNQVNVTITGEAGSGKSTAARIIARALMEAGIPVVLNGYDAKIGVAGDSLGSAGLSLDNIHPVGPISTEMRQVAVITERRIY